MATDAGTITVGLQVKDETPKPEGNAITGLVRSKKFQLVTAFNVSAFGAVAVGVPVYVQVAAIAAAALVSGAYLLSQGKVDAQRAGARNVADILTGELQKAVPVVPVAMVPTSPTVTQPAPGA